MLNDHTMYEHILDDDLFMGVVGMLECSLTFATSFIRFSNSNAYR